MPDTSTPNCLLSEVHFDEEKLLVEVGDVFSKINLAECVVKKTNRSWMTRDIQENSLVERNYGRTQLCAEKIKSKVNDNV